MITIEYSGNELRKQFPEGTRVSDVINDPNVRAVLGFGGVDVLINGVTVTDETPVADGDSLVLVTRASAKA